MRGFGIRGGASGSGCSFMSNRRSGKRIFRSFVKNAKAHQFSFYNQQQNISVQSFFARAHRKIVMHTAATTGFSSDAPCCTATPPHRMTGLVDLICDVWNPDCLNLVAGPLQLSYGSDCLFHSWCVLLHKKKTSYRHVNEVKNLKTQAFISGGYFPKLDVNQAES